MRPLLIDLRFLLMLAGPVICLSLTPATAHGQTPTPTAPIYNPHTKSYFELRVDLPSPPQWTTAEKTARTKSYKGVRGRLAIIRDIDTHSFLQANFPVHEEAWIGLRFFCSVRKLVWVDGEEQPLSGFKMWAKPWHRSKITCSTTNIQYMPVAYSPQTKGFQWLASGPQKYFVSYFVEYPTGKE